MRLLHLVPAAADPGRAIAMCRAIRTADPAIAPALLSVGPALAPVADLPCIALAGDPAAPASLDTAALGAALAGAALVHVHACLTPAGLFLASHARLGSLPVIGQDDGLPPDFLRDRPRLMAVYDAVLAGSEPGLASFLDFRLPGRIVPEPPDPGFAPAYRALLAAVAGR